MIIPINLTINGEKFSLQIPPQMMLLKLLRDVLGFTGTKRGCGEGDCGACTVIVEGKAVLSCLTLAASVDDCEITTIEGLSRRGELSPLQEAFVNHGAVQCGFCTPGMVMASQALLNENPNPTEDEIKIGLSGNLCRCTGYDKIIEAVKACSEKNEAPA